MQFTIYTVLLSNLSHQRDSTVPHGTVAPKRTAPQRTAPQRNAPHRIILYVTVFKKNTIVTFTVTFYPVTRIVTPIVTLNCNGKYTVTPTVTVIIVKNKALRASLRASLQFW
jgi:hypothetical protein